MQGAYGALLRNVNKEIGYWEPKKEVKSVVLGCDAPVGFQPNQELSTGCGLCGGKTNNIQHNNLEMQVEADNFQACATAGTETHQHLHGVDAIAWSSLLKRWKVLDSVAIPQGWTRRSVVLQPKTR